MVMKKLQIENAESGETTFADLSCKRPLFDLNNSHLRTHTQYMRRVTDEIALLTLLKFVLSC